MYIGGRRVDESRCSGRDDGAEAVTCTWAVTCVVRGGARGDGGSETTICGRGRSMRCVCAGQWPWAPHNGQARRSRIVRVNWGEPSREPRTWAMAPVRRTELGSVRARERARTGETESRRARGARVNAETHRPRYAPADASALARDRRGRACVALFLARHYI